jgi:TRAP-type mannitol/chloroaromatic compound transport system substrate-binding protein
MKRRYLLSVLVAVLVIAAMLLPACAEEEATPAPTKTAAPTATAAPGVTPTETATAAPGVTPTATAAPTATPKETPTVQQEAKVYKWNVQGTGGSSGWSFEHGNGNWINNVHLLTGGRVQINFFAAGAFVPETEASAAVETGTLDGVVWPTHYDVGRRQVCSLFGTTPFGFTNPLLFFGWYEWGGGMEMVNECYNPWNITSVGPYTMSGSSSVCGMTREEYRTYYDMGDLIFRMSGTAGEIYGRVGLQCVYLTGAELFTALERGVVDVAEYGGAWWNYQAGYHEIAPYLFGPGWHEPISCHNFLVNTETWNELPSDLQDLVRAACELTVLQNCVDANYQQNVGLKALVDYGCKVNRMPDRDLQILYDAWLEMAEEEGAKDDLFKRVFESQEAFKEEGTMYWEYISDHSFTRTDKTLPKIITEKADWEDLSAYLPPFED